LRWLRKNEQPEGGGKTQGTECRSMERGQPGKLGRVPAADLEKLVVKKE